MTIFIFTRQAEKTFYKLPKTIQKRITSKLKELKNHDDILAVFKRLTDFEPATHRLRIGNYRVILALKKQTEINHEFWILDIGHRKDIYR